MTENARKLAREIEDVVSRFVNAHGSSKASIRVVLSDGHTLLTDDKAHSVAAEELVFVQIPDDWIKAMHLYPKSPTSSGTVTSFACPHCGGAIKYSK